MLTKTALCFFSVLSFSQVIALADSPTTSPANEFYIGGDVLKPGVWPIGDTCKLVLTAIESAELKDGKADYQVTIIHRVGASNLERITTFTSLNALRKSPGEAADIAASDIVQVKLIKA